MQDDRDFAINTVVNYEFDKEGNFFKTRVTIAPSMVQTITADDLPAATAEGRELKNVTVCMLEGVTVRLLITELDLLGLERATGTYYL